MEFDPNAFLNQEVNAQNDTTYINVPVGEYNAIVLDVSARQAESKSEPGTMVTMVDVTYSIEDDSVRETTGLPQPTVRQTVFIDLDDSGQLSTEKGKNIGVGKLREALGCNEAGVTFNFDQLKGKPCLVKVKHVPDRKDSSIIYANVDKVASF